MTFTLYNSSAGSGKTYTLVLEYLGIVLTDPSKFNKVLAVTFTNKAASEMKERIIQYLLKISKGEMREVIEKILNEYDSNLNEDKLIKNAEKLLKRILHNYSDFSVMTIDSFIYRVVSAFSLELDLPLGFEVDMNTGKIVSNTVNLLIEDANNSNKTGKILKDYILSKIHESDSWNYEQDIENIGKELFSEKSFDYINALSEIDEETFFENLNKLKKIQFEFENTIRNYAKKAVKYIKEAGLSINDFKNNKGGIAGAFEKLSKASKSKDYSFGKRFRNGDSNEWVKKDSENTALIEKLVNDNLEDLRNKIVSYFDKNIRVYTSTLSVLKSFSLTALIRELNLLISAYKKENGIVPISDFNKIVGNIIKKEIIPFIYWRVGDKFENYLLDEFQDTSSLQLHNLFPLIENSYSAGFKNIAVGDPKQSIYRWRSSNPEIMGSEIRELVNEDFFRHKRLKYNFRSEKTIVDFNNKFFSNITKDGNNTDSDIAEDIYSAENVEQIPTNESGGYVEIFSIEDKIGKPEFRAKSTENTIKKIREILNDGFSLKDIVILTRTNNEGSYIAEELFKAGIKVISQDSLFLNSSKQVRFIISALKYTTNSEKLHLIEMIGDLRPDLFNIIISNPSDSEKIIDDFKNEFSSFFLSVNSFMNASLYETAENIIRIFNLNEENGGYIQGFVEILFEFEQREQKDIFSFLEFWEDKKASEECALKIPSGLDAVSIMTIHKSKGLEFPIVIVPFANWDITPASNNLKKNSLWIRENGELLERDNPYLIELKKSLAESTFEKQYITEKYRTKTDNINLLYVAFTRAISKLYISINPTDKENTSKIILERINEMKLEKKDSGYFLGKREEKNLSKLSEDKVNEVFDTFNSVSWTDKITIKKNAGDIWSKEEETETKFREERIKRGKILHKILSDIIYKNDLNKALSKALYKGSISEKELKKIRQDINDIFNLEFDGEKIEKLFSKPCKIYCEKEILTDEGVFKPDRIIIREQETVILEYKTGIKKEKDTEQVKKYISIMQDTGYNNIRGYIIYTVNMEIIKVVL